MELMMCAVMISVVWSMSRFSNCALDCWGNLWIFFQSAQSSRNLCARVGIVGLLIALTVTRKWSLPWGL